MKGLAIILVLAVYSSKALADLPHYTTYKSFQTAFYECAEYYRVPNCTVRRYIEQSYPPEEEVKKLIRCTLINLGSWDDETGVHEQVLKNYFVPRPDDTCYEKRTRECLASIVYDNDYTRAYESFKCYLRYYGELISDDEFVPYEQLELQQLALTSLTIAHLPLEVLIQYCKGEFEGEKNFPDLLYIFLVRGGFYSSQSGWNLANLYTQLGYDILLDPATQQCLDDVAKEKCNADELTRLFEQWQRCIGPYVPLQQYIQIAAKQLLGDQANCLCNTNLYNGN
ncbi:general odorant-binding protein 45-like [Sabethes cyaneus]|uniref:general odorant-binding protein 45-like n=1 Tax=Sabethes cyaneus TaxID=53552 RepID=UPI00237D3734|nr:general odorant-binding protein 45-like [Sabethes cyaneus]